MQTSQIHLPAPLRSPGVTRLPRYYGCSDSCADHRGLAIRQVSLRHAWNLPSILPPTASCPARCLVWFCHRALPRVSSARGDTPPFQWVGASWASPITRRLARAESRIEFTWACLSARVADWTFTSGCSPPRLLAAQLPSVSGFRPNPGKDLHLAGSTKHLQAHECGEDRRFHLFRLGGFGIKNRDKPRKTNKSGDPRRTPKYRRLTYPA